MLLNLVKIIKRKLVDVSEYDVGASVSNACWNHTRSDATIDE